MVAYSFKRRFRERILSNTKRQTIRAERKRHARPGKTLQLYEAMRTKHCLLLGQRQCDAVVPVRISVEADYVILGDEGHYSAGALDAFAIRDGFDCWEDMRMFWRAQHPGLPVFSGVLIRWAR